MIHCLFQGSFNPIHNAHLKIAKYAYETFNFDKIVFIPAFKPPHKDNFDVKNALHRLEMVQLAIQNIPYFDVSAIEYTRNKPSYTFDTITQIYDIIKPKEKINFIIGSDAFIQIETWYKTDELKNLVDFILFIREDNFDEIPFEKLRNKGYNYKLMKLPFYNISSSEIRERCKQGKSIEDLVPSLVAQYIKENDLYRY